MKKVAPKIVPMKSNAVYGMTVKGDWGIAHVKCDKLGQVCEIYPIADWTRPILNEFKGRPLCLCTEDIHNWLNYELNPHEAVI